MKLTDKDIEHIDTSIELTNGRKIVLVDTTARDMKGLPNFIHNANIYCINKDYEIIWQIDSNDGIMEKDAFVYMAMMDSKLKANRFFGTVYSVDANTGKVKKINWNK